MRRSDVQDSSIDQNDFGRNNMISGRAVNRDARAGGIVCDHPAERCSRAGGDVRPETKSVRLEKGVELIEHDTRANTHGTFFQTEIGDLPIVARKIDNQAFADGVSDQTCARAARRDGNIPVRRCANHRACLLRAAREGHANRFDLINRCIGREELPRQVIEPNVAPCRRERFLLGGSHFSSSRFALARGLQERAVCVH